MWPPWLRLIKRILQNKHQSFSADSDQAPCGRQNICIPQGIKTRYAYSRGTTCAELLLVSRNSQLCIDSPEARMYDVPLNPDLSSFRSGSSRNKHQLKVGRGG